MKNNISFPIVGTKWCSVGESFVQALPIGTYIELEPDPDNQADKTGCAVKVLADTYHIGFVPNRGYTCSNCWTVVTKNDLFCKECNADCACFIIGGVATLLTKGVFNKKDHAAYIKEQRDGLTIIEILIL